MGEKEREALDWVIQDELNRLKVVGASAAEVDTSAARIVAALKKEK
jgi:hypothetical protein